jgi:hypothetical protein
VGWSRIAKQVDRVEYFAGKELLGAFLQETNILGLPAAADRGHKTHPQP